MEGLKNRLTREHNRRQNVHPQTSTQVTKRESRPRAVKTASVKVATSINPKKMRKSDLVVEDNSVEDEDEPEDEPEDEEEDELKLDDESKLGDGEDEFKFEDEFKLEDEKDDEDGESNFVGRKRKIIAINKSDDEVEDSPEPKKSRAAPFLNERSQVDSTSTTSGRKSGKVKQLLTRDHIIWPDITEYTPMAPGAWKLSRSSQPEHFQNLLEKGTLNAIAFFLFDTAYPYPSKKSEMLSDSLIMAAQNLKQQDIVNRLKHPAEQKYRKSLQDYIFNHVVQMRWKLRRVVNSLVLSTYPLTGEDRKDVTTYVSFVRKKCRYIYPQVINGHSEPTVKTLTDEKTLKKSQPYKHSAITRALKTFFAGDKSPGVIYDEFFVSTLPNNDEKEIPMSMLAFVASVVHFSLGEWVSGSRVPQKANDLRSEYEKNIAVLNQIACDPRKYHRLMADLYRIASGNDHDGNTSDDGVPDIDLADLDG